MSEISEIFYRGTELESFQHAVNWKSYCRSAIEKFLHGGDVLEVGAGIGGTTKFLADGNRKSWTCLEPDSKLRDLLKSCVQRGDLPKNIKIVKSTLSKSGLSRKFDAIIYIDVLEHIEDDRAEVNLAAEYLKPGGYLIILSPAHQWLYSDHDKAIDHFRRYSKKMLQALMPANMMRITLKYMDSVGMAASLANRLFLKQGHLKSGQIRFWDTCIVPISRIIDPLTGYNFGKSILAVWKLASEDIDSI